MSERLVPSELLSYPDYDLSYFEMAQARAILQEQGVLLLRNCLPPDFLQRILPAFREAYEIADYLYQSGRMSADEFDMHYRYGHAEAQDIPGFNTWLNQLLKDVRLRALMRSLFGSEAFMSCQSQPRRQKASALWQAIPFHQDCEFIGPLPSGVNCWIPLTSVGGTYPGLEFCLGGPQRPLFSPEFPLAERQDLSEVFAQWPAPTLWRPCLQPGDLLIFSFFTVHRTWISSNMPETRYSYELRLISDQDAQKVEAPLRACSF